MPILSSSLVKPLLLAATIASMLSACVSVPESVQLTHNGEPAIACAKKTAKPDGASALDSNSFSLTSWNMYKGQIKGWDLDLNQLQQQSDLLLLQEAHLLPELQDWLDQQSLDWSMAHAFTFSGAWSGVLTSGKTVQLSPCAQRIHEPYLHLPKTTLISYFPFAEHEIPLMVVNIHGVNFTLDTSDLAAQLQSIEEVMNQHSGPVILAGDFNTWSDARMDVMQQLATRQDLQSVTFDAQQPKLRFGHQLDYIYYRGLIPLHSQVIRVESSDHHPLTVTFSLDKNT